MLTCRSFNSVSSLLDESHKYELFAVTVHLGTLEMGHYIAYTKRNGKWYNFNDEKVIQVSESEALS